LIAMNKPNFASVTDVPCTCGVMQDYVANPNVPVVFDEKDKNYFIDHTGTDGVRVCVLLYHCPFCGGVVFADGPSKSMPRIGE